MFTFFLRVICLSSLPIWIRSELRVSWVKKKRVIIKRTLLKNTVNVRCRSFSIFFLCLPCPSTYTINKGRHKELESLFFYLQRKKILVFNLCFICIQLYTQKRIDFDRVRTKKKNNLKSIRIGSNNGRFPPLLCCSLFLDHFFFTTLLFALFFVRLLTIPGWIVSGAGTVTRPLVGRRSFGRIHVSARSRSPAIIGVIITSSFWFVVCIQQWEEVTEFLLLRIVADLLDELERSLHTLVSKHFDLSWLLFTT